MRSELLNATALVSERTLWLVDARGEQAEPSQSWLAFTGQTIERATGAGWRDAIAEADRSALERLWTTPGASVECGVLRPNGKHTRAMLRSVSTPDGLRLCCLDEVWADASVRRSEERLRLATQAAQVAIWEYDFLANQMTRTENHDALYGLSLSVWHYEAFTNATHPDDRARSNEVVQQACAKGGPDHYAMDFRVIWPDGSVHWLACTGNVVLRGPDGKATLVRGTLSDVSRMKAVEAELRDAVSARDDFLQVASHELKTPLTALALKLERLKRRGLTRCPEEFGRDLAMASDQLGRLNTLINQLLDVTRLAEGRLKLERQRVDLAAVTKKVASVLGDQHGVPVQVAGPETLPGEWDLVRIEQVVENLVNNALKYGRKQPVQVELSRVEGKARLEVVDHGIGIEPEAIGRLFCRFERAPSARAFGGLGLGLYIVKQIVAQHGGEVRAESRLGEGSRFTVELP